MHPYLRFHLLLNPETGKHRPRPSRATSSPGRGAPLQAPRIRRVLGKALIDRFCEFEKPHCDVSSHKDAKDFCPLAAACPYGVTFAASLTPRPPFAIYLVPAWQADEPDLLEVSLFGAACSHYPWLLAALETALLEGLGKARKKWRVVEVLRVFADRSRQRICGPGLEGLPSAVRPEMLGLATEPFLGFQNVEVQLLSPTRLVLDGKLIKAQEPISFGTLIARTLDRFEGLFGVDSSEILQTQFRQVIEEEAHKVPLLHDDTRWVEVHDYSTRSRSKQLRGGKVGRLVYGEAAARFLPILRVAEALHVGKNPTSGCGRLRVDLPVPKA